MGEKKTINSICNVLNGFAFKSEKYVTSGIRVIRITNVQKGYVVDDDPKYYPESEMSYLGQYLLRENDLLMSLTGNVGRVGLLTKDLLPAALNQRVACLRIKDNGVRLKYLFYYLHSDLFEKNAIFSASGIAQKNMSTEWLKKVEIPVPTLAEQQRIVEELDLLTSVIDKKKAQLRDLDALAQSIFYEMFGDLMVSERWPRQIIKDLCIVNPSKKLIPSNLLANDTVSFLPMEDLEIKAGYAEPKQTRLLGEVQGSYTFFAEDDVLLAKVTPCFENGKVGIASNLRNGIGFGSSEFFVIRPIKGIVKEVIYFLAQTQHFVSEASKQLTGTSGLRRVPRSFIENLSIAIPPMGLQEAFAERIKVIEKEKITIGKSIQSAQMFLDSRMDAYFG